jgi:hypothetical protein
VPGNKDDIKRLIGGACSCSIVTAHQCVNWVIMGCNIQTSLDADKKNKQRKKKSTMVLVKVHLFLIVLVFWQSVGQLLANCWPIVRMPIK